VSGQVDLDLLADYVGGALAGTPQQAEVERLVAEDPEWGTAYQRLSASSALIGQQLAALGAVDEPMPADVATRLDEALTGARAPLYAIPGDGVEAPTVARRRRARWLAPVAAAAGVLAFVGVGAALLQQQGHSASDKSASTAAGEAAVPDSGGVGTAQSPGFRANEQSGQATASGTDYQPATVVTAVTRRLIAGPAVVGDGGATAKTSQPQALSSDDAVPLELRRFTTGDALRECLDAIEAEHGRSPTSFQVVDLARFAGSPAVVVALTGSDGQRWVWVSGPDCGTTGADTRFSAPAA
jgi:hypothetical protein